MTLAYPIERYTHGANNYSPYLISHLALVFPHKWKENEHCNQLLPKRFEQNSEHRPCKTTTAPHTI